MNVAKKRQRLLAQASKTRHVLCVDFLGVQFEAKQLESQLGELLDGIHVSLHVTFLPKEVLSIVPCMIPVIRCAKVKCDIT